MCSLFGWLDYKEIVPDRLKRKLTQALANAAEERGTDAAGISYISDGKVVIYKRPKPAHKLHFNPPEGTRVIMGHTRMTTQGDGKHNYNNHPFPGVAGDSSFAFAHNGVLWNDKELRKDKLIPDTHIETDSYAACQLIEKQGKLDFDSLKYMAETVEGNFTFSILDEHNSLYIVKGSNPMCLLHFPVLGMYVYASTESIMKKALQKIGLHKFAMERITTDEGDILSIDSSGNITRSEFEPKIYRSKYGSWYDYDDSSYYNMHEEILLAYCGCYGVDSSDVELLLEYGYTCDEIEDMLADHDLLNEALRDVKYMCGEDIYESCYGGGILMGRIGYIRVSTEHQETARQEAIMKQYKVERVFAEKMSGKNVNRPELKAMLEYVREGDTLYIESISRLGRSTRDLLNIIDVLQKKGVTLVSSKENIDTNTPQGRFVLSIFAALSELEREQTLQRQREGIAIAKSQGKYKGRQPLPIDWIKFGQLYEQWKTGAITAVWFQKEMGLRANTFYRRLKEYERKYI